MQQPILSLKGVVKRYAGKTGRVSEVLGGIDLDVREGEFIAVLGFSGAGKTTLVSSIAGLIEPDAGDILLRGKPIQGPDRDRGLVFQSYSLFPWLTVESNVALAVDAVHKDRSADQRKALVKQKVKLVGLGHAMDRKPAQLSGGMRQRVAVARALAMEPEILLLDEPLSALDALTRAKLQDEIERIREEEKRTIILVTNDVDEALLLTDRIAVLTPTPAARIGRIFPVDIARPRDREAMNDDRSSPTSARWSLDKSAKPTRPAACPRSPRSTSHHRPRPIAMPPLAVRRGAIWSSSSSTRSTRRPRGRSPWSRTSTC
jgi:nitrate/nitrite transport system ATP-binding protein